MQNLKDTSFDSGTIFGNTKIWGELAADLEFSRSFVLSKELECRPTRYRTRQRLKLRNSTLC